MHEKVGLILADSRSNQPWRYTLKHIKVLWYWSRKGETVITRLCK